jgi:hypothetical protein
MDCEQKLDLSVRFEVLTALIMKMPAFMGYSLLQRHYTALYARRLISSLGFSGTGKALVVGF